MEVSVSIFLVLIFLFSVVVHEISHGFVADSLGDPTARMAGRLTLNPLKHLDPIGSILLPAVLFLVSLVSGGNGIIFGWTKPVPIDSLNFRDKKYGTLKVALAGPLSNLLIAVLFGIITRLISSQNSAFFQNLTVLLGYIVFINLLFCVFNLWPTPPFDGSHVLFHFLPPASQRLKLSLYQNQLFSYLAAVLFIMYIGIPYICNPLFKLLTGLQV